MENMLSWPQARCSALSRCIHLQMNKSIFVLIFLVGAGTWLQSAQLDSSNITCNFSSNFFSFPLLQNKNIFNKIQFLLFTYPDIQFGRIDKEKEIQFQLNKLVIFGNFFNSQMSIFFLMRVQFFCFLKMSFLFFVNL